MTPEPILKRINALLVREFELDASSLTDDARLREDLDLDSLDAVDLIALLEKEFGLALDDDTLMELRTVGEMRGYVMGLIRDAEGSSAS